MIDIFFSMLHIDPYLRAASPPAPDRATASPIRQRATRPSYLAPTAQPTNATGFIAAAANVPQFLTIAAVGLGKTSDAISATHHPKFGVLSAANLTNGVQFVAGVATQVPLISIAAQLLLQLIDLCDAYQCNKDAFVSLKKRMVTLHAMYFGEGGMEIKLRES